jgi:hypothetical protein
MQHASMTQRCETVGGSSCGGELSSGGGSTLHCSASRGNSSGATLDCGSAGTYTLEPAENQVGAFPSFTAANQLTRDGKVVGTLITFAYAVNGEWFDQEGNAADPLEDKVGLTTCSFTASNVLRLCSSDSSICASRHPARGE